MFAGMLCCLDSGACTANSLVLFSLSSSEKAREAKECGAVTLLAQLLHWLQQNPTEEVNCALAKDIQKSIWRCILEALSVISNTLKAELEKRLLKAPVNTATAAAAAAAGEAAKGIYCWEQLEEAPGEL